MDEIFPKALDTCQSSFLSRYSTYELIVYDTVTSRVVRKHINLASLTSQTGRSRQHHGWCVRSYIVRRSVIRCVKKLREKNHTRVHLSSGPRRNYNGKTGRRPYWNSEHTRNVYCSNATERICVYCILLYTCMIRTCGNPWDGPPPAAER